MGFCRYCGDLIPKELEKCRKCGGVAVRASFAWNDKDKSKQGGSGASGASGGSGGSVSDRWTRTYMTREESPGKHQSSSSPAHGQAHLATRRAAFERPQPQLLSPSSPSSPSIAASKSATGRRFPLPQNSSLAATSLPSTPISNTRVASHIAATTTNSTRTRSTTHTANSLAASPSGNPIIDDGYTLSKVYGSALQNPDTLKTYACASCTTTFQRDSTMYPDPSSPTSSPRFLCRDCFIASGGVKADCAECRKHVYKLKKEGDFVENGGRVWHAKCFECHGCGRNTAKNASVDLMGRPCCAECFDTSLQRSETTRPRTMSTHLKEPEGATAGTLGGMLRGKSVERGRESNPAMEELTQRLGIASKDTTPSKSEIFVVSSSSSPTRSRPSSGIPTSASAELQDAVATYSPRSRALNGIRSRKNSEKSRSTSLSGRSSPTLLTLNTATPEPQDILKMSSLPASAPFDHPPSHFLISNALDATTAPQIGNAPATSPNTSLPSTLWSSTSTVRGIPTSNDCIPSTRNHTSLDSTPNCARTTLDDGTKTRSRIPLPHSIALSKRSSDGNGTPDLASDGGSESTCSLDASPPTPRDRVNGSRDAIGDDNDTPMAKRIADSIKMAATGESYGGPSEVSEDMDEEEMNVRCTKCNGLLYSLQGGGKIVTVPSAAVGDDVGGVARYHARCFVCAVCQREFSEGREGAAVFVKSDIGITHVQCAPPPKVKVVTRPRPSPVPVVQSALAQRQAHQSSASVPSAPSVPATKPVSTRPRPISALTLSAAATNPLRSIDTPLGTGKECPGCKNGVAMFEPGVVPGPGTTRWHSRCLICGGPEARRRSKANMDTDPGCGKRLDRDAKVDDNGGVWCNTCFPKVFSAGFKNPLSPTATESAAQVFPRYGRLESRTGFIPRYDTGPITPKSPPVPVTHHYTGAVFQQLTGSSDHSMTSAGGDMGRARSGSTTKAMGGAMTVNRKLTRIRPRPKSVAAIRLEGLTGGRGMELINHMTGGTATEALGDA